MLNNKLTTNKLEMQQGHKPTTNKAISQQQTRLKAINKQNYKLATNKATS
jgi:hypothetical protein